MKQADAENRRVFLKGAARNSLLAGLAALTALLARRRKNDSCRQSGACRGCARLPQCRLPAAASERTINAAFSPAANLKTRGACDE